MDYRDAIMETLDAAGQVKLPHYQLDVVTIARREFAKRGCCDHKFIAPIESVLRECLRKADRHGFKADRGHFFST